jgi:hypothetical protein
MFQSLKNGFLQELAESYLKNMFELPFSGGLWSASVSFATL